MEQECLKLGYSGPEKSHSRWCSTMSGQEFGRIQSWGAGPKRGVSNFCSFSDFLVVLRILFIFSSANIRKLITGGIHTE
jgi:hypothetical protein